MNSAPDIDKSSVEERREYIKTRFPCIADCDMCGLCTVFHGKDAELAYEDYINGKDPVYKMPRKEILESLDKEFEGSNWYKNNVVGAFGDWSFKRD